MYVGYKSGCGQDNNELEMSFFKRFIPINAKASISLDKPTFAEGEAVVGKVNVDASEYVQSTGVRVEARAYEHYEQLEYVTENNQRVPKMVDHKDTLFSRDVDISGPSDFGQGPTRTFPFTVGIPPVKPVHGGGRVEYEVKGVVAVKGRPDITGTTQIAFTPPAGVMIVAGAAMQQAGFSLPPTFSPQGSAPQGYTATPAPGYAQPPVVYAQYSPPPQPKVQVRCSYCQSMIDQGTSFCPNCGGRQ